MQATNRRHNKVKIYTDGVCFNNSKQNAQSEAGIWFSQDDQRNKAIHTPGNRHFNQIGELVATITAIQAIPHFTPLVIVTDSEYIIKGLTTHLPY